MKTDDLSRLASRLQAISFRASERCGLGRDSGLWRCEAPHSKHEPHGQNEVTIQDFGFNRDIYVGEAAASPQPLQKDSKQRAKFTTTEGSSILHMAFDNGARSFLHVALCCQCASTNNRHMHAASSEMASHV